MRVGADSRFRYAEFESDLLRAQMACEAFDEFFSAVEDPRTRPLEAFFGHASTLSRTVKR